MEVKTYEQVFGKHLTVRDLVDGFDEDTKTGRVCAFGGNLNVRPPYQREFVYEADKQQAVIQTIMDGYPLNVMYWAKSVTSPDTEYEVMDGQQRILSICKFFDTQQVWPVLENGKVKNYTIEDFNPTQKQRFLDYPLLVYICEGDEREILGWFRIINIAGVRLTEQEMRNACFNSAWVTDAKRYFSNVKGLAYLSEGRVTNGHSYGDYVDVVGGSTAEAENAVVRQKLLEITLTWATDKYNRDNGLFGRNAISIEDFMRMNRDEPNAVALWRYYEDVMEWVKDTFPEYRPFMKKVEWGLLYNQYNGKVPARAADKVKMILDQAESELAKPKEVYRAVLSGDMKYLNARSFSDNDKRWAYRKQSGRCPYCHKYFGDIKQMHGDHIVPWSKGGITDRDNLQMLCTECNLKKSAYDVAFNPWDSRHYDPFDLSKWDEENRDADE